MFRLLHHPQFLLHSSVFLFGFTAILGDLIELSTWWLVLWRSGLATLGFFAFLAWRKQSIRLPRRRAMALLLTGGLLGLHWVFFFGSIAAANVSIGLVTVATGPFMTALLEPLIRRRRLHPHELILGALTVCGIYMIYSVNLEHGLGIVFGLLAAFTSALVGIFNKELAERFAPVQLNAWEMLGACLVMAVLSPAYLWLNPQGSTQLLPSGADLALLLLLAFVCTNFAYVVSVKALRKVTTFNFMLAINMEPIYGILMAVLFLGEARELNTGFVVGSALVLSSVFLEPLFRLGQRRLSPARRR
mgnify:CR=1 FL=1